MIEFLREVGEFLQNSTLLANVSICGVSLYVILRDITMAFIVKGKKKIKEVISDTGVKKEDLVEVKNEMLDVLKEVKQLKKAIGTAYANSKLDSAVKLRVQDELDGKETQSVEVVKVEEPVVETTKSVAEKLESQLK